MQRGQSGQVRAALALKLVAFLVSFSALHADALVGSQLRLDLHRAASTGNNAIHADDLGGLQLRMHLLRDLSLNINATYAKISHANAEPANKSTSRAGVDTSHVDADANLSEAHSSKVQQQMSKPWKSFLNRTKWSRTRWSRVKVRRNFAEDIHLFLTSAVAEEWISFGLIWVLLVCVSIYIQRLQLTELRDNGLAIAGWMLAAAASAGLVLMRFGTEATLTWIDGYMMEFLWGLDNFTVYLMVVNSLNVPAMQIRKAVFAMSIFTMLFQMVLYMGVAGLLSQLAWLPYVLGVWLVYSGWEMFKLQQHHGHDSIGSSSTFYKAFDSVFGGAILPEYSLDGHVFVVHEGRTRMTLLGVAISSLVMVMCVMEVDTTLTKIEESHNHFLNLSSSVLATFAVPEMFVVAQYLFDRFFLMPKGLALLLAVNGGLMLCLSMFQVPQSAQIVFMMVVVFSTMLLSVLLEGGTKRKATPEKL